MAKCPRPWALAQTRGRLKRPGPRCREPARARGSPPPSWTFSTIGSPNGVVVDKIDDWDHEGGADFFLYQPYRAYPKDLRYSLGLIHPRERFRRCSQ